MPKAEFDRAAHCRAIAAKGGRAKFEKYGREVYREMGRKGWRATAAKFKSEAAYKSWLADSGLHNYWRSTGLPMKRDLNGKPIWPEDKPVAPWDEGYTPF